LLIIFTYSISSFIKKNFIASTEGPEIPKVDSLYKRFKGMFTTATKPKP